MLTEERMEATIVANQSTINNNHMVGIKHDGGIRIIKCDNQPKLIGTDIERSIWNKYPLYEVKDGIPKHALLHIRNANGSVYRKTEDSDQ